jgi:prefoldin subunit 5
MVEKTIMQRIDKEIEDAHRHIQHEVEEIQKHEETIHRDIDETRRYIDSRIDKVVATGSLTSAKRQING